MQQPSIWNRLIKLSLPVMFSLLIHSIYNIADSYFVARYSSDGLAALSLIYPIQLFMTALATGTGSGLQYTHIVFLFSFGLFAEANATKLLQAKGNTVLPMLAQIAGAVLNILLDPILIYGLFGLPAMGMMYTVYFQSAGRGRTSLLVTVLRQVVLLVPLAWLFHFKGLTFVWFTFPVTEIFVAAVCLMLDRPRPATWARNELPAR